MAKRRNKKSHRRDKRLIVLVLSQNRKERIILTKGEDLIRIELYKDANGKVIKIDGSDDWDIRREKLTLQELEDRDLYVVDQKARRTLKKKIKKNNEAFLRVTRDNNGNI